MQMGMVGLGRMGQNMVLRLAKAGHQTVVFDSSREVVQETLNRVNNECGKLSAVGATSFADLASQLAPPRAVWLMVPAGIVDRLLRELVRSLQKGDILIDSGNSHHVDDIRRAAELAARGIRYIDVGLNGGVWGLEAGYSLMIGGSVDSVKHLESVFKALAPGRASAPQTPGREHLGSTAEEGYLHCGPAGAGHFVKMVHDCIEVGLMQVYAEGLNILEHANVGLQGRPDDSAEVAPLREPERYRYDFNLSDIVEVWRRGSLVRSGLLDLTALGLAEDPDLRREEKVLRWAGVPDSEDSRWTLQAAIDEGVPCAALAAALHSRLASRHEADFASKVVQAMRRKFGDH